MLAIGIYFGFAVRTFELPFYDGLSEDDPGFQDYNYFWNGMWLVFVTFCTVEYGDFYPKTLLDRLMYDIVSFLGLFIISLVVLSLGVYTQLTENESRAYEVLWRAKTKKGYEKVAGRFLLRTIRYQKLLKSKGLYADQAEYEKQLGTAFAKFEQSKSIFSKTRQYIPLNLLFKPDSPLCILKAK